jgi:hypothetical protein
MIKTDFQVWLHINIKPLITTSCNKQLTEEHEWCKFQGVAVAKLMMCYKTSGSGRQR